MGGTLPPPRVPPKPPVGKRGPPTSPSKAPMEDIGSLCPVGVPPLPIKPLWVPPNGGFGVGGGRDPSVAGTGIGSEGALVASCPLLSLRRHHLHELCQERRGCSEGTGTQRGHSRGWGHGGGDRNTAKTEGMGRGMGKRGVYRDGDTAGMGGPHGDNGRTWGGSDPLVTRDTWWSVPAAPGQRALRGVTGDTRPYPAVTGDTELGDVAVPWPEGPAGDSNTREVTLVAQVPRGRRQRSPS